LCPGRKEQADDSPHGRPPDWQRRWRRAIQCQGWVDTKPAAADRRERREYGEFARRILRAYSRRVADGDVEALSLMTGLADELDAAIAEAVRGLRARGYSWAEIGARLGITRQAAQQRWGTPR
jgi:hypothetical protein